jgi:hypothetical protein
MFATAHNDSRTDKRIADKKTISLIYIVKITITGMFYQKTLTAKALTPLRTKEGAPPLCDSSWHLIYEKSSSTWMPEPTMTRQTIRAYGQSY